MSDREHRYIDQNLNVARTPETSTVAAGTYEGLLLTWEELKTRINQLPKEDLEKSNSIGQLLNLAYKCFCRPPYECDSAVKRIFEEEGLLQKLEQLEIPPEFLLQCVRVGAIKSILSRVESSPQEPVVLNSDGTQARIMSDRIKKGREADSAAEEKRLANLVYEALYEPSLDGYSWANQKLRGAKEAKAREEKLNLDSKKDQEQVAKLKAVDRLKNGLGQKDFKPEKTDAALLREDFQTKLMLWKAFFESNESNRAIYPFIEKHGKEEITPELFQQFQETFLQDPRLQESWSKRLPLEIINPNSGWFYVLVANKKTNLREFYGAACSNMNRWFEL